MIYIDDAIESIHKLMSADKENLSIKSSYNLSGFSLSPEVIENELKKIDNSFKVEYTPDFRQKIADSWPDSINDDYARKNWSWNPNYDLKSTIYEMIEKLKIKVKNDEL